MKDLKHFIDGDWISGSRKVKRNSPHTKVPEFSVPTGDAKTIKLAVSAARRAQADWAKREPLERAKFVLAAADWLVERYGQPGEATSLKERIRLSVGKPIPEADIEVIETSDFMKYFCSLAEDTLREEQPKLDEQLWPTKESFVRHVPYGVVAIIKPWNYPLEMIAWSAIPALLAGNTVVIKPSERSPDIGVVFGEIAHDVALPSGVLNVVLGDGATGRLLSSDDGVDFVSFTGSMAVGQEIALASAERFRGFSLETSGNDAAIVLADADLELAANGIVWGAFCNAGQVCVGTKRVYVHRSVYSKFRDLVLEKTRSLRMGSDVGPMVDPEQVKEVAAFVRDARKKGARILHGGESSPDGYGFFPTILEQVPTDARLYSEECFGPVMPLAQFEGEEEAITLASSGQFGLGASVWTQDKARAKRIASRLHVGMVWINDVNVAFPQTPWGGYKYSGFGYELGSQSIRHFTRPLHISDDRSTDQRRAWWYPY